MDGDNYSGIGTYLHGVSNTVHFNYNLKGENISYSLYNRRKPEIKKKKKLKKKNKGKISQLFLQYFAVSICTFERN